MRVRVVGCRERERGERLAGMWVGVAGVAGALKPRAMCPGPLRPTAPARRRRRTTRASSRYRSANIGSERCIATAVPSYTSFFVDSSIESPAPIRMIHI